VCDARKNRLRWIRLPLPIGGKEKVLWGNSMHRTIEKGIAVCGRGGGLQGPGGYGVGSKVLASRYTERARSVAVIKSSGGKPGSHKGKKRASPPDLGDAQLSAL